MSAAPVLTHTAVAPRLTLAQSVRENVGGSPQSNNVTYVNFLPAAPAPTRLRLTTRGRRVLTALVAIPLVIGALALAFQGSMATASSEVASNDFHYVTIASGQSLWQLAQEVAPNVDPRDFIAEIVALNHITGEIQVGQRIALPAGY